MPLIDTNSLLQAQDDSELNSNLSQGLVEDRSESLPAHGKRKNNSIIIFCWAVPVRSSCLSRMAAAAQASTKFELKIAEK